MKLKKLVSIALSILMIVTVFPLGVLDLAASAATSGQCGENAYWSISNNTLTISGSGRMWGYSDSFSNNPSPWSEYDMREAYNKVVISAGITNVSAYAFYFCRNIVSVSLPSTVTMLGENSFSNCDALRSITIPQGVRSIPKWCFDSCSSLEKVVIPDSVQSFGYSAFKDTGILECEIPEGVTNIPHGMFWDCSNLQKVTIPKSVATIETFAFHECGNLTDVYYGGTKSDFNKIKIDSLSSYNEGLLTATIHYKCDQYSHVYDNSCDDTCNLCGYKRTVTHTYTNSCDTTCNICGYTRKTTHQYDNSCDEICNVCGYERTVTHSYKTTWNYDVEQHWQSCSICGKKRNSANHNFNKKTSSDGTQLLVCSVCKFEMPDKDPCINNAIDPIVIDVTTNSITLMALDGYEYSIDGQNFKSSTTFSGLNENQVYTVYQRIKETDKTLASKSSSITVRTAFNGETTNTYYDKLVECINKYGVRTSDGYKGIIPRDVNGISFTIINRNPGIEFEVINNKDEYTSLKFVLYKGKKDIFVEGYCSLVPGKGTVTIDRSTYNSEKTYNFKFSDSSFLTSNLQDSLNELYNSALRLLCLQSEKTIYEKFGFGLKELGFISFVGAGKLVCDPTTGYHTGKTELRYQRNALCTIDGYTGDGYCSGCGGKISSGSIIKCKGSHTFTNDCDSSCNICGFNRTAPHTYSNSCDDTCNICGFKRSVNHKYDSECDETCNLCGETRTTSTAHTYSNSCDDTCDICGFKRSVNHKYDSECDEECNLCGRTRKTSTPHTYSNNCDTTCNLCGAVRKVNHTFTSDCDETCNICGFVRDTSAAHIYSSDCDAVCNVCGSRRKTAVEHKYNDENVCELCGARKQLGDVNNDGKVNAKDAIAILRHDAEIELLTGSQIIAGDLNGDKAVNSKDAILILQYDAQIIEKFPIE